VETSAPDPRDFALAFCPECRREVLTYPDFEADGADPRRCLHCDERLAGELRWVGADELTTLGYEVSDADGEEGSGCVTCVRGGCAVVK
jgi:hypothetical protein